MVKASLCLVLSLVLFVGCEGSSDAPADTAGGDTGAAGDTGGTSGDASGDTSGSASGACAIPAGATVLAGYRRYNQDDASYPAYAVAAAAGTVYVAFFDKVVAIPQAGGEPTTVYTATSPLGLGLYRFGADAFLIRDGSAWLDLSAGAATAAPFPPALHPVTGLETSPSWVSVKDADTIWVRFDDSLSGTATYILLARGEATPREVAREVAEGRGGRLVTEPTLSFAVINREPTANTEAGDELMTVAEGGARASLGADRSGLPVLLTPNFLYFDRAQDAALDEQGLWRVPTAGGAAAKLGGTWGGFSGVASGGQAAFLDASALWVIEDAPAASALTKLLDLPVRATIGDSCTPHGVGLSGGEVIGTMYSEGTHETLVFKVAIP